MAGGPTTTALVRAAAGGGSLGFLAGGSLTADALEAQLLEVASATELYGVNLFAPNPVRVDVTAYSAYRALLGPEAERLGVSLPEEPVEDDDGWQAKVDVLLDKPVPVVSF